MSFPTLDFNGVEGHRSTGLGGPDAIEGDLRELANMLDPGATLKNGAPGGIGPENMKSGVLGTAQIQDDAVTTQKIAAGAVTNSKVGTGAISSDKIQDRAIGELQLADRAVSWDKLSDDVKSRDIGWSALFKNGSGTFSSGGTTCVVTDAFITANTQVIVSPDPAVELAGKWDVISDAGFFTITSSESETQNINFDWGATK